MRGSVMQDTRRGPFRKWLAIAADLAVIGLAIIVGVSAFERWHPGREQQGLAPLAGVRLDRLDIPWRQKKTTVVVVLQPGCQYCAKSAEFYARLAGNPRRNIQFVAVFPHSSELGEKYLHDLAIPLAAVPHDVRLPWARVVTPTLAVCDSGGTILRVWVGLLNEQQQREVQAFLGARDTV